METECYMVTIWRLYRVDLAKLWPEIAPGLGASFDSLSENVEKALDYVAAKYLPMAYERVVRIVEKERGTELVDAISMLEEEMLEAGNYTTDYEPVIGFVFYISERLSALLLQLPPPIAKLAEEELGRRGKYGELYKEPLAVYRSEDGSIAAFLGIVVERREGVECESAIC